jgi:hypothetical protein
VHAAGAGGGGVVCVGAGVVTGGREVGEGWGLFGGVDRVVVGLGLVEGVREAGLLVELVLVAVWVACVLDDETGGTGDVAVGAACWSEPWHAANVRATATTTAPTPCRDRRHTRQRQSMTPPHPI